MQESTDDLVSILLAMSRSDKKKEVIPFSHVKILDSTGMQWVDERLWLVLNDEER